MDWFARRGFDTWCMDNEGYGRSDKKRNINFDIANGADDIAAATEYILSETRRGQLLIYGISSGALKAALFAERHPERVEAARARRVRMDRRGQPDLGRAAQEDGPVDIDQPPADRQAFIQSIFTRDHPGSADDAVIERSPKQIFALDDRCRPAPTSTCARNCRCRPAKITAPTIDHARGVGRHRQLRGLIAFFMPAAQSRQAVRGDARHQPRSLPAEELRARLSHPAQLFHPARADLSRLREVEVVCRGNRHRAAMASQ